MYDQILFPTDGSDGAKDALDHALDIAAAYGATIHLLNVADTTRPSTTRIQGQIVDTLEQEGERIVDEAADRADARDVPSVTDVIQGEPYGTIVEYAEVRDIDLVVMPTHGRQGLERYLLGSTTERVVRRSNVPVLTVPMNPEEGIEYPYRDVLVPTDGSDCADRALEVGIEAAKAEGAAIHFLSVVSLTTFGAEVQDTVGTAELTEQASELIEDAEALAEDAGVGSSGTVERDSSIGRAILSYVDDHGIDLVVVGTHGRTGIDRYVLGSVAERLVRTASVPVLTVRGPVTEE
jgi:nucleotide-binding universal stress UspA family protein